MRGSDIIEPRFASLTLRLLSLNTPLPPKAQKIKANKATKIGTLGKKTAVKDSCLSMNKAAKEAPPVSSAYIFWRNSNR
jgi:hypothetical protein